MVVAVSVHGLPVSSSIVEQAVLDFRDESSWEQ